MYLLESCLNSRKNNRYCLLNNILEVKKTEYNNNDVLSHPKYARNLQKKGSSGFSGRALES